MSEWKPTIKRIGERPDDPLADIKRLMRRRNFDRAERELLERIEGEPKSADLMILLGRVLRSQNRHDDAMRAFERAIELAPLSAEPSFRCGAAHLRSRNIERARELFENALKIEPNSARAYLGLGAAAYFDGAYDDALERLAQAIKLDPKLGRVHEMSARTHARMGDKNSAIDELQGTLEEDPNNERILTLLVRLLRGEGRSGEALEILQARAENAPENRRAQRRVAGFALRTGQPDLAVATYRQLTGGEKPRLMDTLRLIGALIESGEIDEANSLLQSLSDRRGLQPVTVKLSGDIAFQQGEFDRAIEHYKKACLKAAGGAEPDGIEAKNGEEAAKAWREHAAPILRGVLRKRQRRRDRRA